MVKLYFLLFIQNFIFFNFTYLRVFLVRRMHIQNLYSVVFILLKRHLVAWQHPALSELRVWFGNYLSNTTRYKLAQSRKIHTHTQIITLYTFAWKLIYGKNEMRGNPREQSVRNIVMRVRIRSVCQ